QSRQRRSSLYTHCPYRSMIHRCLLETFKRRKSSRRDWCFALMARETSLEEIRATPILSRFTSCSNERRPASIITISVSIYREVLVKKNGFLMGIVDCSGNRNIRQFFRRKTTRSL